MCEKEYVPLPMGNGPISVPKQKPVSTHTHVSWVWVLTDIGKDRVKNTRGLPMSNTTYYRLHVTSNSPITAKT